MTAAVAASGDRPGPGRFGSLGSKPAQGLLQHPPRPGVEPRRNDFVDTLHVCLQDKEASGRLGSPPTRRGPGAEVDFRGEGMHRRRRP